MSNIQTGAERMPHDLSHLGFLAGQIGRLITISTTPVIVGDSYEMDAVGALRLSPFRRGLAIDSTVVIFTFFVFQAEDGIRDVAVTGVQTCALPILNALTHWQPFPEFPVHVTVSPDPKVYSVALLLSVGSGVLWGLVPMRQIWTTDSAQVMKSGGAGTIVFRRFTLRDLLLGIQITLCTLLVTSSFVALRGMQRSLHAPLGFRPEGVLLAETDLHMGGHSDASIMQIRKRMLEEVSRLPGVTSVGIIDETPLGTGGSSSPVYREGTTDFRMSNSTFGAKYFSISPGYLQAAGTRLLGGRDFTWHDDAKSPKVAIVNEAFARSMFGNTSALGRRFLWGEKLPYEIVGVVENGKYDSLTETPWAAMFIPLDQSPDSDTSLVVRSPLPEAEIVPEVRRRLAQIDPSLPFVFHSWPDELAFVLFPARVATATLDRKSTRLNSSHGYISYAVFCLKKKNTTVSTPEPTADMAVFPRDPPTTTQGSPQPLHAQPTIVSGDAVRVAAAYIITTRSTRSP